jgi:iron complex outermembrane receptor protein
MLRNTPWLRLTPVCCAILSSSLLAVERSVEYILVQGERDMSVWSVDAEQLPPNPDVARWLKGLPGADVNSNGPVTGIAQYRGLYGDRVNVAIGGRPVIGAGPNAMDAPLSYAAAINVEQLQVYRGIAPVSAGLDTLGGAVEAILYQPEFIDKDTPQLSGVLQAGGRDNGEATDFAGRLQLAGSYHSALFYAQDLYARDDWQDGDDRDITPSIYHKRMAGAAYRYRLSEGMIGGNYDFLDTRDAGTPALPMDIDYIQTHRAGLTGSHELWSSQLQWQLGYTDADHVMDNYRLRLNTVPQKYRKTKASSDSYDWRLALSHDFSHYGSGSTQLVLGLDGVIASHDAQIRNPNSAMFYVDNFHDVEDRRYGIFVEWQQATATWDIELGARLKYIDANAGNVQHSMAMMNDSIRQLVTRFNSADKQVDDTLFDLVGRASYPVSQRWRGVIGLAVKQRGASYQERYLWLPMQSTGGLADGNTYVGDIHLDPETAWQIDTGADFNGGGVSVSPRIFYQRIDDYIQGTPSTDPLVQQVAAAMGDESPLQFSNLDAELYGFDVSWSAQFDAFWRVGGQASYTRGKRRDIKDNLYRIAPANMGLFVEYALANWSTQVSWRGYAAQKDVAASNQEQASAGYGILGLELTYLWADQGRLRAGVSNLLDHGYQDHLAGYNRVSAADLAVAERLPGEGRTLWLALEYLF